MSSPASWVAVLDCHCPLAGQSSVSSSSSSTSAAMPSLLHSSKRRRLDHVLTRLANSSSTSTSSSSCSPTRKHCPPTMDENEARATSHEEEEEEDDEQVGDSMDKQSTMEHHRNYDEHATNTSTTCRWDRDEQHAHHHHQHDLANGQEESQVVAALCTPPTSRGDNDKTTATAENDDRDKHETEATAAGGGETGPKTMRNVKCELESEEEEVSGAQEEQEEKRRGRTLSNVNDSISSQQHQQDWSHDSDTSATAAHDMIYNTHSRLALLDSMLPLQLFPPIKNPRADKPCLPHCTCSRCQTLSKRQASQPRSAPLLPPLDWSSMKQQQQQQQQQDTTKAMQQQHSPEDNCHSKDRKQRSHSDSDIMPDYFNLFKLFNEQSEQLSSLLASGQPSESNMPKTTSKPHSEDCPLDLSVKSPSPAHIFSALPAHYSDLLLNQVFSAAAAAAAAAAAVTSVPSSPQISPSLLSTLAHSLSTSTITSSWSKPCHKRRNISSLDSHASAITSFASSGLNSKHSKLLKKSIIKPQSSQKENSADQCLDGSVSSTVKAIVKQRCSPKHLNANESFEDGLYGCTICGQTFTLHDRLAKHIASRHKNRQQCDSVSKNYLCDVCQRSFARSDMLTRHMRLHTGIKPYTCKVCAQVFSRSDHLSTHQRTHTGEKPYKCPQCPYAACRRDMITRHMRTHSRYDIPDSSSCIEELAK